MARTAEGAGELAGAVTGVRHIADDTTERAQRMQDATVRLATMSSELSRLVEHFDQ